MLRVQVNSSQLGNISLPRNAKWAHWHQETALYEWFTSDGNVPISEIQRVCEFPEEFFEPDNTLVEHIPTSGLVLQNEFEESQMWVYNRLYFFIVNHFLSRYTTSVFVFPIKKSITQGPNPILRASHPSEPKIWIKNTKIYWKLDTGV